MAKPEITRVCLFCESAVPLADGESVLCEKKGVVTADYVCRGFRYDPLKRVPKPPVKIAGLEIPEDGEI